MTNRWQITPTIYSQPDKEGRQSFDLTVVDPTDRISIYTYKANLEATIKRLRHTIAENFWFDRMRIRLAKENPGTREAIEARARRTSIKPHERFDPSVAHFLTALPDDACDRDADGFEYGPSIEALVEIFEREERDAALKDR